MFLLVLLEQFVVLLLVGHGDVYLSVLLLGEDHHLALDGVLGVVVDLGGVESLAAHAGFEMQVLGGGSACTSGERNRLSGLHPRTFLHQVAHVVAVGSLQSVGMTEHYEVAISVIGTAQNHFAREGGTYCVARLGLDVGAAMPACTAEVAYYSQK